jgi:hypothetical protein
MPWAVNRAMTNIVGRRPRHVFPRFGVQEQCPDIASLGLENVPLILSAQHQHDEIRTRCAYILYSV